jgi:hypothetical protein
VQQGDPLGSALFALGNHPCLVEIAQRHPEVLVTGYADNTFFLGPLQAVTKAIPDFKVILQEANLQLNTSESNLHVPHWATQELSALAAQAPIFQSGSHDEYVYHLEGGDTIPLAHKGLQILGCPAGTDEFCTTRLDLSCSEIERDLDLLQEVQYLHQRTKLAIYCCNTRATHLARSLPLHISEPRLSSLDSAFDSFMAHTLGFELDYDSGQHGPVYKAALAQLRLGIKQGGFGLTSQKLVAPAALLVATREFQQWLTQMSFDLVWLPKTQPDLMLPSTELWKQDAIRKLSASCSISLDDAPQHVISEELKATSFQALSDSLSTLPGGNHRLLAVCAQKLPAGDPKSDICPGSGDTESDYHRHRPTGLLALLCPFELSNAAFITSSALLLGTPVPHALYLRANNPLYAQFDVFGDKLLNDSSHASHSRTQSHDHITSVLADLATQHGLPTSIKNVPFADSHSQRRADLVTCRGGLVRPNPRLNFGPSTLLVMDFELGHTFTSSHQFKPQNIANMELQKRSKYLSAYHDAGLAFAPLVSNSLGQFGPDLLRFLWGLADHAARNQVPVELQDLPHLDLDSPAPAQAAFQRLRSLIYVQASYRILAAVFEGVTERIYGRTFALRTLPAYQRSLAERSQPWLPSSHPVASLDSPASPLSAAPPHSYSSILLQPPSSSSPLPAPIPAQLA